MSLRSDQQRALARKALTAEARCLTALNQIPPSRALLDTPQLRRAQTRGPMVERIPDALAAAESMIQKNPEMRPLLGEARLSWAEAEGLRWEMVGEVEGLIRRRAGQISRATGLEVEDLVQEGRLGALRAARRYDPDAQNFTTYVQWWIRAAMTRSVDVEGRLVRLPGGLVEQQRQITRISSELISNGESPSNERLAEISGLDLARVRLIRSQSRPLSLDVSPANSGQGEEGDSLGMLLADEGTPDPEQEAITAAAMAQVETLLEGLDERTRTAVTLYFGLGDEPPLTLSDLGKRFGLSRERVRQIINQAVLTIRPRMGVSASSTTHLRRRTQRRRTTSTRSTPTIPIRKVKRRVVARPSIQERLAALMADDEE